MQHTTHIRSHMMHDPSELDEMHSVSLRRARIHVTSALCSLSKKCLDTCNGPPFGPVDIPGAGTSHTTT